MKLCPFCFKSTYRNNVCDVNYILEAKLDICYFIYTEVAANLTFKSITLAFYFDNSIS